MAEPFELTFLFTFAATVAIVCLLVTAERFPAAGRAWVEVPRLTVLAEVCLLKVDETVDFVVTVLSCGADFKEVCDDDFFILDAGCDQIINFTKELKTKLCVDATKFFFC